MLHSNWNEACGFLRAAVLHNELAGTAGLIPARGMDSLLLCCVSSGRDISDKPITSPEESYQICEGH